MRCSLLLLSSSRIVGELLGFGITQVGTRGIIGGGEKEPSEDGKMPSPPKVLYFTYYGYGLDSLNRGK